MAFNESIVLLFMGFFALGEVNRRLKPIEGEKTSNLDRITSREIFLEGLFVVISGLAITAAVEHIAREMEDPLSKITNADIVGMVGLGELAESHLAIILNLAAFFAFSIPFYHGGFIAFLEPLKDKGERQVLFTYLIFIIVFANAILLYFAAVYISNLLNLMFFVWILLMLNIVWLPIQLRISYYFDKKALEEQSRDPRKSQLSISYYFDKKAQEKSPASEKDAGLSGLLIPGLNWFVMDFLLAAYLWWKFLPIASNSADVLSSSIFFVALLARGITDYSLNWGPVYRSTIKLHD